MANAVTEGVPRAPRTIPTDLRQYLLAFADDEHLMGQRHTEWIGVAPFLEEDLAFSSIGQDELGHAAALYALLVGDDDEAIDRLAFRRPSDEYRSCWLVEYETNEWAETLVRHWFYDSVEQYRWEIVAASDIQGVSHIAQTALREESFHVRHADGLLDVLLAGDESRRRVEYAVITLWPLALAMFDGVEEEKQLVAKGILTEPLSAKLPAWRASVIARFPSIDLASLEGGPSTTDQASRTVRHPDFEAVYSRMREVLRLDPDAVW